MIVDLNNPDAIEQAANNLQLNRMLQNSAAGLGMSGSGIYGGSGGGSGGGVTLIGQNGIQRFSQNLADRTKQGSDIVNGFCNAGFPIAGGFLKAAAIVGFSGLFLPAAAVAVPILGTFSTGALAVTFLQAGAYTAAASAVGTGFVGIPAKIVSGIAGGVNNIVQGPGAEQARKLEAQRAQLEAAFQLEVDAQELAAEYGISPKRAAELAAAVTR
jgi:hypothetical protein